MRRSAGSTTPAALTQKYPYEPLLRKANAPAALRLSARGSQRLLDIMVKEFALFGVPTYADLDVGPKGEIRFFLDRAPSFQLIESSSYYHSDMDTPDIVPPTSLEAVTRAYAKIIDGVNKCERRYLLDQSGAKDR